ncbi:MAG: FliM/FliN family flagellar motor switch protein [Myxococcota bacterium]|nr:FliM/FliN family flagellar motor switch protein [Myxococcota bacterium]
MAKPGRELSNEAILGDIPVEVVVELGRLRMVLRDLAALSENDVLELDQQDDSPLELVVNGRKLAQGELIQVGGHLALRITEVYA